MAMPMAIAMPMAMAGYAMLHKPCQGMPYYIRQAMPYGAIHVWARAGLSLSLRLSLRLRVRLRVRAEASAEPEPEA